MRSPASPRRWAWEATRTRCRTVSAGWRATPAWRSTRRPWRPDLTVAALAAQMAAPENAAMRKSTARRVEDEDLIGLARLTLGLGR